MKKKSLMIYILTALILTAALLVSGGCNGGSDEKKKAGDAESFKVTYATSEDMAAYDVSMDKQIDNLVAAETDADALGGWGWVVKQMAWMEAIGQGGYYSAGGLSSINLSYWTVNAFGQLTKADAAVFVPHNVWGSAKVPIVAIQHPTEVLRKNSPSKLVGKFGYNITDPAQAQMHLAALIARMGYIVVMADYLGMGENTDTHPYCHELLANSVRDAISAASTLDVPYRVFPPSVWDKKKVMLMGFSEGGYATMVTAKKLQADGEFPVTAVAALDGPYSLSGTMHDVMVSADKDFSAPYFLPYVLNGYSSVYGDKIPELKFGYSVRNDVSGYRDYPGALVAAMDGSHDADYINDIMKKPFLPDNYDGPRTILSKEFLALLNDRESVVCKTLGANDSFAGWTPSMPLKMFHHVSDDLVPIGNMTEAKAAFDAAKAKFVEVESFEDYVNIGDSWHVKAFLIAFLRGFIWLDYYGYGNR